MGKISYEDKARMETLQKQETWFWIPNNCCEISGKGLKALLNESKCKRVDERGSATATERKPASDRPKTARTEEIVRYLYKAVY